MLRLPARCSLPSRLPKAPPLSFVFPEAHVQRRLTIASPLDVQVVAGFDQLQGPGCSVQVYRDVGLAVLRCPEPLHYYSLFSHTCGCDYVLTMYDHNR